MRSICGMAKAAVVPRGQGWVQVHSGELQDLGYDAEHHSVLGESLFVLTGRLVPARPFG